jgi:uncharacterized protein (DUF2147 family)
VKTHRFKHALPCLIAALGIAAGTAQAAPPSAAASFPPPQGTWLDQSGRAGITIAPCGEKLCGSITWLRTPLNEQGKPKTDIHNADANLRTRPLCGLPMLNNFVPDGENAWTGGTIYDPERGETYQSNMHIKPDGTLVVRGYVGISLLGRSETWTKPAQPLPHCAG